MKMLDCIKGGWRSCTCRVAKFSRFDRQMTHGSHILLDLGGEFGAEDTVHDDGEARPQLLGDVVCM